jgi:hypothetical protein
VPKRLRPFLLWRRPLLDDLARIAAVITTDVIRATAGCHTFDALDFVALVAAQIPDKGQVLQRYYGYYSSRARGMRRKAAKEAGSPVEPADITVDQPDAVSRSAACRRWAELLRRIFEVDPLTCPSCCQAADACASSSSSSCPESSTASFITCVTRAATPAPAPGLQLPRQQTLRPESPQSRSHCQNPDGQRRSISNW